MKKNILLLLAGLLLMIFGALNGEITTVLTKATTICLECIGIG